MMLELKSALPNLIKLKNDPIKIKAFQAASEAMAELFTAGIIGNVCVKQQYLTASMVSTLSKTCFSILLPMFLCTSIMKTIHSNGGKVTRSTIIVPIIAIGHCLIVHFVSKYILLPLFQMDTDTDEGRSTIVCCTFGNSGVIPLIFAEALFRGDSNVLQEAYSFISLYLVGWSPLFWSFGRTSLLGSESKERSEETKSNSESSMLPIIIDQFTAMKSLFPPPVIGTLFGLTVSSIPSFQGLFMRSAATSKPLLGVVYNCFQNFGRAANPLALLVLTSSLALGTARNSLTHTTQAVKETKAIETLESEKVEVGRSLLRRMSCVSIARFIISPLLMTLILRLTIGDAVKTKGNTMIWFVLILQSCMPSAQNSVLMLQVAEKTMEASKLAKFLFSIYTTSMIPIVLIATYLLEKCNLT